MATSDYVIANDNTVLDATMAYDQATGGFGVATKTDALLDPGSNAFNNYYWEFVPSTPGGNTLPLSIEGPNGVYFVFDKSAGAWLPYTGNVGYPGAVWYNADGQTYVSQPFNGSPAQQIVNGQYSSVEDALGVPKEDTGATRQQRTKPKVKSGYNFF